MPLTWIDPSMVSDPGRAYDVPEADGAAPVTGIYSGPEPGQPDASVSQGFQIFFHASPVTLIAQVLLLFRP